MGGIALQDISPAARDLSLQGELVVGIGWGHAKATNNCNCYYHYHYHYHYHYAYIRWPEVLSAGRATSF